MQQIGATLIVRLALIAMSIATSVMLARLLGPEGRGVYATAIVLATVASQFAVLGLHTSGTYFVARERTLLPKLVSNALCVAVLGGTGVSVIVLLLFRVHSAWAPVSGTALMIALVLVPATLAPLLTQNLLLGIQEVKWYNVSEVVGRGVFVIASGLTALLLRAMKPEQMLLIALFSTVVTFSVSGGRLMFITGRVSGPDMPLLLRQLTYGIRPYIVCLAGYFVLKIDIIMVRQLAGIAPAGYYSLASNMSDFLYSIPTVVGMMLFPVLSTIIDPLKRWERAKRAMAHLAPIMFVAVVAAAACATPLIKVLYGSRFLPAAPPFLVLSVAIGVYSINSVMSAYLSASGQPWFSVWLWLAAALFNIGLNLYFIPVHGIVGAAVSSLITYSSLLVAQFAYAKTHYATLCGIEMPAEAEPQGGDCFARSGSAESTPRANLEDLIPLDRQRVLVIDCGARSAWMRIANRYAWMKVRSIGLAKLPPAAVRLDNASSSVPVQAVDVAASSFVSGSVDCVCTEHLPERNCDLDLTLGDMNRILLDGGVLVALVPVSVVDECRTCGVGGESALHNLKRRLEGAGFVDVSIRKIKPYRGFGVTSSARSRTRRVCVMAWKRRKLASSMDRAIEVMNWTHYALAPGLKSESGVDPVKIISSGRGSCWDYCCILNELLDREGYKVTWISMVAEGHPCGCGPRQRESHEVLEVEADGRLLVLDPTTNNCLPYGFLDLLREPALAQHKFLLDEDYRSRRFHLYDTQEWFSRVVWYKLRVGVLWKSIPVRRRRNPYSLERATPAAVLHSEDLTTRKPEISR